MGPPTCFSNAVKTATPVPGVVLGVNKVQQSAIVRVVFAIITASAIGSHFAFLIRRSFIL
jgi:hypothetical protein